MSDKQPEAQPVITPGAPNSALKEAPPKPGEGVALTHPARGVVRIIDADEGLVEEFQPDGKTPRKSIAIVGFASSSRMAAPYNDPTWSIWSLNQLYRHIPRADRTMDIHANWDTELVPGTEGTGPGTYHEFFRTCGMPVYLTKRRDDLPTSVTFPLKRLTERFGATYFTSTIAYELALAIDEIDRAVEGRMLQASSNGLASAWDVHELVRSLYAEYTIGLFGIDLVCGEEYFWQKACAEFWIGIAVSRNIKVMIPPQSALCKQPYLYGYEKDYQAIITPKEIGEHSRRVAADRDEGLKGLYMMEGALQILDTPQDATLKTAEQIRAERDEHLKRLFMMEGVLTADSYWTDLLELRLRGAEIK